MAPPAWTVIDFLHTGPWWKNHGILMLNLCILLPLMTSITNGLDTSLINGLQILPKWQETFNTPKSSYRLGLINAAQVIGNVVGVPIAPLFSDSVLGRKGTMFVGASIMLAGVAIQCTVSNVKFFIMARALVGFGLSFNLNAAPLLITELAYPTHRGKIVALYNSSWYFGSSISAWVCFISFHQADGRWTWTIPSMVQAFLPFLTVCLIFFIPESPRFLVARGLEGQAAQILAKYHANGRDERDPLVVFELAQIRYALKLERSISKSTSYMTLFATPGNRKRMMLVISIGIFSQWSGNGLVSYYIDPILRGVGIENVSTIAAINGGLQVFNLIMAYAGSLLIDKVGRRTLFIISNSGMLVSFTGWTITTALYQKTEFPAAAKATVPLIFLFYFFYDLAYTPLLVAYTLEILPFTIRSRGFAVSNFVILLQVAFNMFINPLAIDKLGWYYYLFYVGFLGFELIFVLKFVVETRGRTLEETAALFDGEEAAAKLVEDAANDATGTMGRVRVSVFRKNTTGEMGIGEEWLELNNSHPSPTTSKEKPSLNREEVGVV